jgi:hypothetical protein
MRRAALLGLVFSLAGCGGAAPEGFTLSVRFLSLDVAVIDSVRLAFRPAPGLVFQSQPEMTFEGGAITMRVESDGALALTITGAHIRANLDPDEAMPTYDLEIWSDDPAMRSGPVVLGSATNGTELIADGTMFLPAWPPPLGQTTQIVIQCTAEAAIAGRCMP